MKVIVTEAGTYIGRKIASFFLEKGYEVVVIAGKRSDVRLNHKNLTLIEKKQVCSNENNFSEADAAVYLKENIQQSKRNLSKEKKTCSQYLKDLSEKNKVKHIICLETILDNDTEYSLQVKAVSGQKKNQPAITFLQTDFIIGSGSPSFEAIRNIVEKIPVMIVPSWIKAPCNPTGIDDLLEKLHIICGNEDYFNKSYMLGSNNSVSLGKMILLYARMRGMIRLLISLPFSLAKLSGYLICLLAKTPLHQSENLIKNLKRRFENRKEHKRPDIITPLGYTESLKLALGFTSALKISRKSSQPFLPYVESNAFEGYTGTPVYGCYNIKLEKAIRKEELNKVTEKINSLGAKNKLYFTNWLWHFKGWTNWLTEAKIEKSKQDNITEGDNIDFWKVQITGKDNFYILLYADLFLPGEGWLELKILPGNGNYIFRQTFIFRPLGFTGRFYWFWTIPFHYFVLKKIMKKLISV